MNNRRNLAIVAIGGATLLLLLWSSAVTAELQASYKTEVSVRVTDRNGELLLLSPNVRGHYMTPAGAGETMKRLVVLAEDRFFYFHPGVNPVSTIRGAYRYLVDGSGAGGSTITQQLVKNLLHQENERTVVNKLREIVYAILLEMHTTKEEILDMYLDVAYFGGRNEGIHEASWQYFGKGPAEISESDAVHLLTLLTLPSARIDSARHMAKARVTASVLGVALQTYLPPPRANIPARRDTAMFELDEFVHCEADCTLFVDRDLTARIRALAQARLESASFRGVGSVAVAVLRVGEGDAPNNLLALVGSSRPGAMRGGSEINMALQPRPVGSTWKPFVYARAFEKGARPYTLVEDAEYRSEAGSGFSFYPKNYDGQYRGQVTLASALANSLNVPAARTLEFVGVEDFARFMEHDLGFASPRALQDYQLSLVLGGIEMSPLALAHYYAVLARQGVHAPLAIGTGMVAQLSGVVTPSFPALALTATATDMITRILSDRLIGAEQFGIASNLDLPFQGYAVKTGTSYDYHDSWTAGYTPDVVVVVWIGNADNAPLDRISGARGAGAIWNDVMHLLYSEGIVTGRSFMLSRMSDVGTEAGLSYGLPGDDVLSARMVMADDKLIREPHDGDVIEYEKGMRIPLSARERVRWMVDGATLGHGAHVFWTPVRPGEYRISATNDDKKEEITLQIKDKNNVDE